MNNYDRTFPASIPFSYPIRILPWILATLSVIVRNHRFNQISVIWVVFLSGFISIFTA